MALSSGDKVKNKYNIKRTIQFDIPAGSVGKIEKVHLLSGNVDVSFEKYSGIVRDADPKDFQRA